VEPSGEETTHQSASLAGEDRSNQQYLVEMLRNLKETINERFDKVKATMNERFEKVEETIEGIQKDVRGLKDMKCRERK
jgi:23S rRNA maturation-related 3'-5' exoribonuclease YhaM